MSALQEGCPFLSPFSFSDECLGSQQQLTTALSSRKRVEAVEVSISCGLEDRWGFPGTGRRCGGTGSTPTMGTSDLGSTAWECGSPFPAFLLAGTCLSSGASSLCQPVSHEHHGEFAQSRSLLPNLSTNEEANSWDGCSAGRSEPSQPDMALSMAPSSFLTSLVVWGAKKSWERDAPRESHVQDGTIDWKNVVPQSRALVEPCLTNRRSLTLHEAFAGLQHREKF